MKVKTSELTGAALDWAVAKCNGKTLHYFVDDWFKKDPWLAVNGEADQPLHSYTPSTDWGQGGPIIERERIEVRYRVGVNLTATIDGKYEQSVPHNQKENAQLTVAMRCYVASKLGDEVEIPEEIREHS